MTTAAFAAWLATGGDDGDSGTRATHGKRSVWSPETHRRTVAAPDVALIALLREGDERAFEALYHANARAIAAYIVSVTHAPNDVQDLLQETYMALWRRRTTLSPSDHILGFLYRTARNLALTRARHAKVVARTESDVFDTPPGAGAHPIAPDIQLDIEERHRYLADALASLPERQRLAIHLRYYEEMPYASIGEILGISEKAAHMLVSRAIAALRPIAALFVASSEGR